MFCLAHLKQKGFMWDSLHGLYAVIVHSIEMHESSWSSDWCNIEEMVLDIMNRDRSKGTKGRKGQEVWYCREFNRVQGCALQSSHEAQVGRRR